MTRYIARRVLAIPLLMLGVATLVFMLVRVLPGDIAEVIAGPEAPASTVQAIREELGLDQPALVQYAAWLGGLVTGNMGTSLRTKEPVAERLLKRWPVTAELTLVALMLAIVIAVPIGVASAVNQDGPVDHTIRVFAIIGLSVPEFWLGTIAVVVLSMAFHYAPPLGFAALTSDPLANLQQILLPAAILATHQIGALARLSRATMLEVLRQDYVRTAWAKGLSGRRVIYGHALRNALLPVVTVLGLSLGRLLGGTVILESIFRLPGIGSVIIESIVLRDMPVIQGAILVFALIFALLNLLTDLAYTWLDPRISYA